MAPSSGSRKLIHSPKRMLHFSSWLWILVKAKLFKIILLSKKKREGCWKMRVGERLPVLFPGPSAALRYHLPMECYLFPQSLISFWMGGASLIAPENDSTLTLLRCMFTFEQTPLRYSMALCERWQQGGNSEKQAPPRFHGMSRGLWVTWFCAKLYNGDVPEVMFIGVDFDVMRESTWAQGTHCYLLVGSRICSQLCGASLQPGVHSDGNCWWSHLQKRIKKTNRL